MNFADRNKWRRYVASIDGDDLVVMLAGDKGYQLYWATKWYMKWVTGD